MEVYCKNCKYLDGYFYKGTKSHIVCNYPRSLSDRYIFENLGCYHYKRKWWKFWIKK